MAEETLFSLEVLVYWVRLEPVLGQQEPPLPAVAFRLLDFPTVLIHAPEEAPPSRLLFPFGRGKSCLFCGGVEALLGQLGRAPLYAMLLDLRGDPPGGLPRLLGSCPLSLAAAARGLLGESRGGALPGARAHRGVHPLHDLLGRPVGELSLEYRLLTLGGALLRHIAPAAREEEPAASAPQGAPPTPWGGGPTETHRMGGSSAVQAPQKRAAETPAEPVPPGSAFQQVPVWTEIPSLLPTEAPERTAVAATQTEVRAGRVAAPDRQELEIEANVFCPPPMYYSHVPPEQANPRPAVHRPQALQCPPSPQEEEEESTQKGPPQAEPDQRTPAVRGPSQSTALGQLPLLSALLLELSLLNPALAGLQDHCPSVHPQLAWLYRPTDQDSVPPAQNGGEQRSPSPRLQKRNRSNMSAMPVTPPPTPSKTRAGKGAPKATPHDKPCAVPPVGQPKKKLMYGLTNTLRLRLQQCNPDMLILHERREKLRKQQAAALKEKKSKARSRGILSKSPRSPEQRRRSHALRARRGLHSASFDENIETLIQSSRVDEQDSGTKDEQRQPYSENQKVDRILQHRDENIATSVILDKENYSLKDERPVMGFLPSPLPRAPPQETDSDDHTDLEESIILAEDGDSQSLDYFQQSAPTSPMSTPELKKSEGEIGNLDYTGYSDDFTSPDYTARYSVPQDSSPEPILLTPKSYQLDVDSDSYCSTKSGISSKSTSITAPVPVISNVSPVHSSKRALDVAKPHSLVTAVKLSSSDRFSPETLDDEHRPQRDTRNRSNNAVSKALNPEAQTLTSISVRNYEFENGETLLETGQSFRTSQVAPYILSTISELQPSFIPDPSPQEEIQSRHIAHNILKQYKLMTELAVNQLPGYTL